RKGCHPRSWRAEAGSIPPSTGDHLLSPAFSEQRGGPTWPRRSSSAARGATLASRRQLTWWGNGATVRVAGSGSASASCRRRTPHPCWSAKRPAEPRQPDQQPPPVALCSRPSSVTLLCRRPEPADESPGGASGLELDKLSPHEPSNLVHLGGPTPTTAALTWSCTKHRPAGRCSQQARSTGRWPFPLTMACRA